MALVLIVEDGTGNNPDANGYVDADYVADYADSIGSTSWCDNTSKQSLAIVQATRFIDLKYGKRARGSKLNPYQPLVWPRADICGLGDIATGLPKALKDAVAHAAIQYIDDGSLDLNPNQDNNIKSKAVSVGNGAVSESTSYFAPQTTNIYSFVDGYMNTILRTSNTGSGNIMAIRG